MCREKEVYGIERWESVKFEDTKLEIKVIQLKNMAMNTKRNNEQIHAARCKLL